MSGEEHLRIGDAEREAAVSALGEHFAAGRLTKDEYDERAERVWAARTQAELWPMFTDLPAPSAGPARSAAPSGRAGQPGPGAPWPATPWSRGTARPVYAPRLRIPFLPLMLVGVGLSVLLHAPVWLFFLAGWLLLTRGVVRRR